MTTSNDIKTSITKDQMQIPNFPLEIIIEILSRLPVKSLFKFKCVSKSWLSLISSSQFAKFHLKISAKDNKSSHKKLLLLSMYLPHTLYSCPLNSVLHEKSISSVDELYIPWNRSNIIAGVGSCNGLFFMCIGMYTFNLFLWNPSTRKKKKLPFSGHEYSRCDVTYGFGYDEYSDDYKVVEIYGVYGVQYVYGANIKIYSLRANSWKMMNKYSDALFSSDSAVFLNGSLHWAVAHSNGYWDIVSLSLKNEKYGNLALPNHDPGNCNGSISKPLADSTDFEPGILNWALGKLKGCLSLFCDYYKVKLDVWIMKEYNVKESWTKLVSLPYTVAGIGSRISPLCISDSGEVLLHDGSRVLVYNAGDNEYKSVQIRNMDTGVGAATVYAESLISPNLDSTENTL
ncbi:PREDICTED: F-box/kelch-repeat protein At3g23880-like [Nicotiana attenuata]|nr:PREDICTED: F-box/kelch-repeat protein At3g23880-like [Nicotiana attenuata]